MWWVLFFFYLFFIFYFFFIFLLKNCELLFTFLQKNINVFKNTLVTIVNEFVINELVKLTML